MKINALLIGGLSLAFALTACSLDEVQQVRETENDPTITFKPVIPYTSRASVTTTSNIDAFSVWAWNEGNEFMDAVTASRNGSVFTTSPLYFWPIGTVDFYALSPVVVEYGVLNNVEYALIGGEITIDENDEGGEHWTYTGNVAQATIAEDDIVIDVYVPGDASEQIDLCYAITKDQSGGSVPVNFRHALSQIVFKARNTNEEMTIKIAGASVCSVYKHGTYTLKGVGSTTTNLPTSDIGTGGLTGTQGSWGVEEHKARFAAGITATTLEGIVNENVAITTADGNLMLLPQTVEAWDVLSDSHDEGLGAYIRVLCNISEDGSQLWPNTLEEEDYAKNPDTANLQVIDGVEYGEIAIPVDIEWEEGYRYTYNIIFGEGAGYYPPDDPNYDLDGTPILYPITFDVTVDEFQDADGIDVPTDTDYELGDEGDGDDDDDDDIIPYLTDENFAAYILENFDTDGDGKVTTEEAANVRTITCHTASDFTGIEHFPNLTNFTSYSAEYIDLSQNTELTTIHFSGVNNKDVAAPLYNLDLSKNTKITSMGSYAFDGCENLEYVIFPESLTNLGTYTFYNCTALTYVELPATLTSISTQVFRGCTALESIKLPAALTQIGERAFQGCSSLKAVELPEGFTTLSNYAFYNCTALAEINFPETLATIGNYAFYYCSLISVVLPESLTSLGTYSFNYCTSLETIDFSKTSLTSLSGHVCHACSSLVSVTLASTMTSLETYSLSGCSSLTTIELPETLTSIGTYAFNNCGKLETITIPESVESLGNYAFYHCNGFKSFYAKPATPPSVGSSTFEFSSGNANNQGVLYVPEASYDLYLEAGWENYFKGGMETF